MSMNETDEPISKTEEIIIEELKCIEKWEDFNFKLDLLRGIYSYGFEKPSVIQQKAIFPIISGNDVIGQASSGSGKTGAFTIGTLQRIDVDLKKTQALIIAPTHELVKQISVVFEALGSCLNGLRVKTLIGGTSVSDDLNDLKNNVPHVIVGCTGRIFDMMNRGYINSYDIKILVLDEADEMLSSGFKENIYNIFQQLSSSVQVALFSATMPEEVLKLTEKFMRNPIKIVMKAEELSLECIQQYYIAVSNDRAKYDNVKDLFSNLIVSQCIIFVNSVNRVVDLYNAMTDEGFSVCCIHSSMNKIDRETAMTEFRKGCFRVLISSNITARGIDVQQVSTVVNFDIPRDVSTYLHRIGRSGRWGRKGLAINFITRQDIQTMKTIEKYYKISINEFPANFNFVM